MDFRAAAINNLRAQLNRKAALEFIQKQINVCRADMEAIQAVSYKQTTTITRDNAAESNIIKGIGSIELLERRFIAMKQMTDIVDDILTSMDKEHRLALEYFYICRLPFAIERLSEKINCSQRTGYRIKKTALQQFIEKMYGS